MTAHDERAERMTEKVRKLDCGRSPVQVSLDILSDLERLVEFKRAGVAITFRIPAEMVVEDEEGVREFAETAWSTGDWTYDTWNSLDDFETDDPPFSWDSDMARESGVGLWSTWGFPFKKDAPPDQRRSNRVPDTGGSHDGQLCSYRGLWTGPRGVLL